MTRLLLLCLTLALYTDAQDAGAGIDLNGRWQYAGGSVITVTHDGADLLGVFVTPNADMKRVGFQSGDWTFRGTLKNRMLRGTVHIRYPLEFRESCPSEWDAEAVFAAEVAPDMSSIEGQWKEQLISSDCRIVRGGWVPLKLRRIEQ